MVDLVKGFHQVEVEPESIPKTAFLCHRGKFEWCRMPFGVKNAPAVFQLLMSRTLARMRDYSRVYIDDVIIYSESWEDHIGDIRRVLLKLREVELTVKRSKCVWGGRKVEFLGVEVGEGVCSIPARRVEAIRNYAKPTTRKGLQRFLGLVSYYRRFIKGLAKHTSTLSPHSTKSAPRIIVWTGEKSAAFQCIRELLCGVCSLVIPTCNDVFFNCH